MRFEPLASVARIIAGQSPDSSTYNSVGEGLPFFQGKADFQDMYPTVRMWCTSVKRKEAEPNDILLSVRAPVGAVNICNQKSIIGRGLAAIRPLSELDGKFLYYYLKANESLIDALGTGSTFKAITQETLKKIEIPVPLIDDQIRIAHLLGKVEGLIAQRKQQLQQLDDLLKSVFLEMFGDPVRNEQGWEKPSLRAFGKISTGNTPPRNDASNYGGQHIEWIKTDNIGADSVFVTTATEYLSTSGIKRARTVSKGALLVACIAGSVESIGRAALTDRNVAFNQQINAIQPANDVSPFFLYGLFKLSRSYIQSHASKGMKKILTKGDFEQITMIKPPFESQQEFAQVAGNIESVKTTYQRSLADLEALYGALSQKAFKGELDLSRVPLPNGAEPELPQITVSTGEVPSAIHLPDTELLLAALGDRTRIKELLRFWVEVYRNCLNGAAFSAQDFLAAAQTRIAELHPENDLELGTDAYDQVKAWVFEALTSGRLTQGYADADNRVTLASQSPDWGTW
ncbi:MAG: restriction endonuclease subunit S [Rhodocyclaceae bacterium]|nr:restriction endonuclease subunit S [Rhodocyclaceae bacterium]